MSAATAWRQARLRASHAVVGSLTLITAPAAEPISLDQAKAHCRISGTDDDTLLETLIEAGRIWIEEYTARALVTQTWEYAIDAFPGSGAPLVLPRAPLQSVTSITSYSTANAATVFASASYLVDTASQPGRVVLNDGYSWPSDGLRQANAGVVRYVAGYGAAAAVPEAITLALRLLVEHWFAHRTPVVIGQTTSTVPFGVEALLAPYVLVRC